MSGPSNNPYAPPKADVGGAEPNQSGRWGFKLYFWAIAALLVVAIIGYVALANHQSLDAIVWAVAAGSMVGLFGYAYSRPIGSIAFWAAWFPVQLLWDVSDAVLLMPLGLTMVFPESEPASALENVAYLAINLPLYLALYRYAYKSSDLWAARPERTA